MTACHVPEGEIADEAIISVLQRGGEGLTLTFPDQLTVAIAQEGEGAVEVEDELGVSRFDEKPTAPGWYLQQTWEKREMKPNWIPLKSREKHAGAHTSARVFGL